MAGDSPQTVTLDRNELGALLVAAMPGPPAQPALVSLPCPGLGRTLMVDS